MRKHLLIVGLIAQAAHAQSQPAAAPNAQAEALNDEGKSLFSDKHDYAGAADKFQQAIALSPDARYYYNLCFALEKLEQYDKAIEACDDVYAHNPTPQLGDKAGAKSAEMRAILKEKGQTAPPVNPNVPPPSSQPAPPPPVTQPPVDSYKWSAGGEIGLAIRSGLGSSDFNNVGFSGKLYANLLVAPSLRIGVQGMVGAASISGQNGLSLLMNDYGLGLYWHLKLAHHLYFTPLVGANLGLAAPYANGDNVFLTFGVRARLGLEWMLNQNDVITFALPDLTQYIGSSKVSGADEASVFGLDHGGRIFAITIGYTRRSQMSFTAHDLGLE